MAYKSKYTGKQVDDGLDLAYNTAQMIQDAVNPLEESLNQEAQSRQSEDKNIRDSIETVSNRVTTAEGQIAGLQSNVATLQSEVTNVKNNVVPKAVAEGIAEVVANAPKDLDTLKEVADYIASDKTKASEIETAISNLKKANTQLTNSVNANATNIAKNASDITANAEALVKQAEKLETKAPKVGYAPDLKVDFAKELVGRGVAEPQEIGVIRPTGEISIGDGNATIEKVKGKSVVWNQKIKGNSIKNPGTKHGITLVVNEDQSITISGAVDEDYDSYVEWNYVTSLNAGHIYAISGGYSSDIYIYCGGSASIDSGSGAVFSNTISGSEAYWPRIRIKQGTVITTPITIYPQLNDLTVMFGAGYEPTTPEEFEARRPLGATDDYNEGEIISYDAKELNSVGFNAFNGTYAKVIGGQQYHALGNITSIGFTTELGGETTEVTLDSEGMFTPSENGYVYAEGTDICIHLTHTYTPEHTTEYEEDTLQLPNIKAIKDKDGNQLFPYGLLSAGRVHDEINAAKAVKRIGVIDLGTVTYYTRGSLFYFNITAMRKSSASAILIGYDRAASYSEVEANDKTWYRAATDDYFYIHNNAYTDVASFKQAMQGVLLYYELTEPIEVDLPEPLNMTYDAWDFGTEEIVAEGKTTPLNADIVYQFNAVDRIRENTAKNQALEAELAELKAQLTQLTQVSNEESSNA